MLQTPILFLIFNRPDLTRQVFESIRSQRPAKLFIAADGPRKERLGEEEKCFLARQIATQIDWTCEWKVLFRTQNLGCGKAVSSAIDWFFEHVEEGIILEDDCLPHPDFYFFCESLLKHYRYDSQVMHLSGNNFHHGKRWGNASYYFSNYPLIWGWATWRRAWQKYDYSLRQLESSPSTTKIVFPFFRKEEKQYWFQLLQSTKQCEIDTWDHQWFFTLWSQNGVAVLPQVNLVTNVGFGESATHTFQIESQSANLPVQELKQIIHPRVKKVNSQADRHTYLNHINVPSTWLNRIRNLSYKYFPLEWLVGFRKARRKWLPNMR